MKDQLTAIRAFNYFATNFIHGFVEKAFPNNAHILSMWNATVNNCYKIGDALPRFYRELSRDNQDTLSKWIIENYSPDYKPTPKPEPKECDHDYEIDGSGGDAESGPETYYTCTKCGAFKTHFGM